MLILAVVARIGYVSDLRTYCESKWQESKSSTTATYSSEITIYVQSWFLVQQNWLVSVQTVHTGASVQHRVHTLRVLRVLRDLEAK